MSELQGAANRKNKTAGSLGTQLLHIKVPEPSPPSFVLIVQHAPNIERMMRGVMIACGLAREDIERLLKERRERLKCVQRLAS